MVGNELADRPLQQTRPPRDDDYETGDTRPVPDPTRLTTLALEREIAHLKEAQKRDRESVKELFRTQFEAQEKALALVQSNADKQPSAAVLQETLLKLREVTDQKFDGFEKAVNQRFDAVNLRFSDNAKAVSDTMLAAKSAVEETNRTNTTAIAKSEAATTKAIDNLGIFANTLGKGLDDKIAALSKSSDDKIGDCKDRLTAIEARTKGAGDIWGWLAGALGLLIAVISAGVAIVVATRGTP